MAVTPASAGSGTRSRGRKTVLDMVRSLGVLLLVVLPAVALWAVIGSDEPSPVPEVDPAPTIRAAAAGAPFAVLAMRETPAGWQVTSASFTGPQEGEVAPSTLRFGYLTGEAGEQEYVGYLQTNEPRPSVLQGVAEGSEPVGDRQAGGATWTVYETGRGEQAWLRAEPDSTLLITGSAGEQEFAALASGLT